METGKVNKRWGGRLEAMGRMAGNGLEEDGKYLKIGLEMLRRRAGGRLGLLGRIAGGDG